MRRPLLVPVLLGIVALGSTQVVARSRQDRRDRRLDQHTRAEYDGRSNAPRYARTIVVPGNVAWTNTGIKVKLGQRLRFEPSGEIRMSFHGDDVAVAAGARNGRMSDKAPIPSLRLGALIGRVNSGRPFPIGDSTQAVQMPGSGTLFLGGNDDYVGDNSGNYVVKISEP
ncbi:MAG: hypothetical protein PVSMB1_17000 [Gemmatimonadaceae bacterium]